MSSQYSVVKLPSLCRNSLSNHAAPEASAASVNTGRANFIASELYSQHQTNKSPDPGVQTMHPVPLLLINWCFLFSSYIFLSMLLQNMRYPSMSSKSRTIFTMLTSRLDLQAPSYSMILHLWGLVIGSGTFELCDLAWVIHKAYDTNYLQLCNQKQE